MTKSKIKKIICASLFFAIVLVVCNVKATTFYSIETRTNQNNKMLEAANSMGSIYRDSYSDLSLKEMAETNYIGLTSAQQYVIKAQAKNIIGENTNLSETEKLEKFYDWIIDNFYYYETPERIEDLAIDGRYNNPYYLIVYEYEMTGKVRAKDNGYAATLIALARTEGIPARIVAGHYNSSVRDNYTEWDYNVTEKQINHVWVEAYVDGSWKMYDPVADSYKKYDDTTLEYIDELNPVQNDEINTDESEKTNGEETAIEEPTRSIEENQETVHENKYFAPEVENLSKTHVAFKTYSGSSDMKYISNASERSLLKSFLNIKSNNTTNGKKINASYSTSDSSTWINKYDTTSETNGYGRVKKLYWPENKGITGNLKLTSFSALEVLSIMNNKLKNVEITGAKTIKTVNLQGNNISVLKVTGSKKLYAIRAQDNPLTYAEYNFKDGSQKAVIKAGKGGTFSVKYIKGSNRKHYFVAKPNSGYIFKGWYKGNKRLSKNAKFNIIKNSSFTYVAKFEKKPAPSYIKVSISKQKLWYYKKGKLIYTSNVVTGQKHVHDTMPGTYSIRSKSRNVYLIGPDYKSFVNYWMPIYGAVGLHDATWRWSFGGDIYTYNGSHGCVNLPLNTAAYIYNNVPTGTTVKIVS